MVKVLSASNFTHKLYIMAASQVYT